MQESSLAAHVLYSRQNFFEMTLILKINQTVRLRFLQNRQARNQYVGTTVASGCN